MLTELLIKNLAIIDEVQVPFQTGFNVLTGETGAGKSIIIHALNFLVGDRGDIDLIRTGEEAMLVEATFNLSFCPQVKTELSDLGVELEDDTLILSRELSRTGRSRCRINGRAATVTMFKQIGKVLVDIHGQHEHQSLLDPSTHLRFLDAFGGNELMPLKERYYGLYRQLLQVEREVAELQKSEHDRIQRLELLRYQADEVDRANLREGEEEELLQERKILTNAERIAERLNTAVQGLSGDGGALDALGGALKALREIADLDPNLRQWHDALSQAFDSIQEVGFELDRYADGIEFDPNRLEEIESRLDIIKRLKRKYGDTITSILRYREQIEQELQRLETSEERLDTLQKEKERLRSELGQAAQALSQARKGLARRLEKGIQSHLKALMMEKAKFKVAIDRTPDPQGLSLPDGIFAFGHDGVDRVEFLIATNPSEPLKPLSKIASGGEISRTMLSLRASLQKTHEIPVLVFDEIDVGIGGRTAQAIGEKLNEVGRYAQVLCVTHLPQIASLANWHLRVEKTEERKRAKVIVKSVQGEERVRELARMLSGKKITEVSIKHAKELLERATTFGNQ